MMSNVENGIAENDIAAIDKIDIAEKVKTRLIGMGYSIENTDSMLFSLLIDKVEQTIKNECNVSEVPNGLMYVWVDRVCGEFLSLKKSTGQLDIAGINLEMVAKSISEGDTRVEFDSTGSSTPEQRLDSLINALKSKGKSELISYRCIKW